MAWNVYNKAWGGILSNWFCYVKLRDSHLSLSSTYTCGVVTILHLLVLLLLLYICVSDINSYDCCINMTIRCSWFVESIVLRYLNLFFVFAFIFVLLMFIIWSCSLLFLLRLTHMINVIFWYLFSPLESKFWNSIN